MAETVKSELQAELSERKGDYAETARGLAKKKAWQPYVDAVLGLSNYWYPAFFSHELAEGEIKGEMILGEKIVFKRVDGRVYALEDRCAHRGVKLSARPECYTKNTITCWYHGFTYNVKDGKLEAIITQPDVKMRIGLRTYPTEEKSGLVFVFIGDAEPLPSLASGTPPGLLDDGVVTRGVRRLVKSNWRHGVENSFDFTHIYLHRNDALMKARHMPLPYATKVVLNEQAFHMVEDEEGRNGLFVHATANEPPIFEVEIEGTTVRSPRAPAPGKPVGNADFETSIWMPGCLRVDPWPAKGMQIYSWTLPIDETTHYYWAIVATKVANAYEEQEFYNEVDYLWKDLALTTGFNDSDIFAREELEAPYAEEDFWYREATFRPDIFILQWRMLCARRHRGLHKRLWSTEKAR
jgi:carbazole 1,9a-dioxygenase